MYGLSPDNDLSPLKGCVLTFVGFGEYRVQLAFSGNVNCAISIESDYVVTPSSGESATFTEAMGGASMLLSLLGQTVKVAAVPSDGTLRLGFENGAVVEVLDSQTHHESYQVNLGDRLLVV